MVFVRACGLAGVARSSTAGEPRAVRASPLEFSDGLPDPWSLSGRKEFRRVYSQGRRARGSLVTVHACRSEAARNHARLGLVVPGRGVSAVSRNRMKRRLRAAFHTAGAPRGFDVVVRASPEVERADFQFLVEDLKRGLASTTAGPG
jgi:ribonuclease P protein component